MNSVPTRYCFERMIEACAQNPFFCACWFSWSCVDVVRCQRNLILFQCLCLCVQGPKQHIKRAIPDLLITREVSLASVCAIVVLCLSVRRTATMRESRRKARTQEHFLSLFMQINEFQQSSCQTAIPAADRASTLPTKGFSLRPAVLHPVSEFERGLEVHARKRSSAPYM